jgi:hypothetical protein
MTDIAHADWENIKHLHPTQPNVGYAEVEIRKEKFRKMSESEIEDALREKVLPVVRGPDGDYYVTDHHHFIRAMIEADRDVTKFKINIIADWKDLDPVQFWMKMRQKKYLYPFDNGKEIAAPNELPTKFEDLTDDPFRGLAYLIREAGGFEKTDEYFAEYQWADFFRSKFPNDLVRKDPEKYLEQAMKLASSLEASKLPGYKRQKIDCSKKLGEK